MSTHIHAIDVGIIWHKEKKNYFQVDVKMIKISKKSDLSLKLNRNNYCFLEVEE